MANSFETRLSSALGQPQRGKTYLAAVSGGADSTAMLLALAALREEAGFALHCVHVEHGIRPAEESRGDAQAVEALCAKLDVPCRVVSVWPGKIAAFASRGGQGIEGAARHFRYRALKREALRLGADWVLTAHTKDDLLETLLMRVLRGSGPAGLSPMPRVRDLGSLGSKRPGRGAVAARLLRPLLDMARREVLAYLEEKGVPSRIDATNEDIKFFRNRIRLRLIPFLDENFPSWKASLLALAETQALSAEFLASEAARRLPWEIVQDSDVHGLSWLRLAEKNFYEAPLILREEAIFAGFDTLAAWDKWSGRAPKRSSVRAAAAEGAARTADLGRVRLERKGGYICMRPARKIRGESGFSLLIKEEGPYIFKRNGVKLQIDAHPTGKIELSLAGNKAAILAGLPLVLRERREGDRLHWGGHKRRFSDILKARDRLTTVMTTVRHESGFVRAFTALDVEGAAAFIIVDRHDNIDVVCRDA